LLVGLVQGVHCADETLVLYLTVRFSSEVEHKPAFQLQPPTPPPNILSLLLGLEVAVEASYISSKPHEPQGRNVRYLLTDKIGDQLPPTTSQPNDLPPNTPSPLPSTSEGDAPYVFSQGRPFESYIFGDRGGVKDFDGMEFTLLWDDKQSTWIGIYRLTVRVSEYLSRVTSKKTHGH
jgi:hypothetical protein